MFFGMSEYSKVLLEFTDIVKSLRALVVPAKVSETQDGVTLLEVKIHSIVSYLTNLCFVMLLKVEGESLSLVPVVEMLAELRIVIEKTRPLEAKLKYQIDKLVKAAAVSIDKIRFQEGQNLKVANDDEEDDELMYAPNPKALVQKKQESLNAADVAKDAVYRYSSCSNFL